MTCNRRANRDRERTSVYTDYEPPSLWTHVFEEHTGEEAQDGSEYLVLVATVKSLFICVHFLQLLPLLLLMLMSAVCCELSQSTSRPHGGESSSETPLSSTARFFRWHSSLKKLKAMPRKQRPYCSPQLCHSILSQDLKNVSARCIVSKSCAFPPFCLSLNAIFWSIFSLCYIRVVWVIPIWKRDESLCRWKSQQAEAEW